MKNCPYCAEEIKDEAIICRYCGKKVVKKRGIFGRIFRFILNTVILTGTLGFASYTWIYDHWAHGDQEILYTDLNHLVSLGLAVIGAFWAWRTMSLFRKKK